MLEIVARLTGRKLHSVHIQGLLGLYADIVIKITVRYSLLLLKV
jgi:hypothetical protein